MLEKNCQQNPPGGMKHPSHFLSPSDDYIVQPLGPAGLKDVLEAAEEFTQSKIMTIVELDNYDDALKILKEHNRPGGMCARLIGVNELAWSCHTCEVNESQRAVLCESCYKNGQHEGHQIQVQRGTGTERCECGGATSFKAEGYCNCHTGDDIDQLDLNDWKFSSNAFEEIGRVVHSLEDLCFQLTNLNQKYPLIVKHLHLLCTLAEHNNFCLLIIVRELAQVSRSLKFQHFTQSGKCRQCNQEVYQKLATFDSWFKDIQYYQRHQLKDNVFALKCRCLRLDNLLRLCHIVPSNHAHCITDLLAILLSSTRFRVMMSLAMANHFKIPGLSSESEAFFQICSKVLMEKSARQIFLKTSTTLTSFQSSFLETIKLYKKEQSKFSELQLKN